ncbi:hypothetical protein EOD42_20330 [Rhodovarius crocodyli]|uniref:DUF2029 domain-containing protein n=1 Tax=Rhodovarius crocodyli TaxID=1979269 RepID=A0A437M305_9PROT|nr:hypothetical protein [Rhodovarius crocodyli]RVT92078.1 hypothetical protein EOD42_20330 [Rhodovarius crocodyli]
MQHPTFTQGFLRQAALLLALMVLGGYASASLGTDTNWNLRNSLLYGSHAFLHGRLGLDVAPAQLQTYLNPLGGVPYYWLATRLGDRPWLLAFVMGMPAGLYAWLLSRIALQLAAGAFLARRVGKLAAWIAVLLGVTGAGFASQIGSSAQDILFACPLLLGLWLMLRQAGAPLNGWGEGARLLLAGLACGAAMGLQPVNGLYALPLGLAALLLPGRRPVLLMGCGMLAGFLLAWLPFALMLQAEFGSLFFPFHNQFFRSPEFPPIRLADERFLPRGVVQALFYPFYWLQPGVISTEVPMMDARMAIGYLAALLLLVLLFRRGVRLDVIRRERAPLMLLVVMAGAYAMWAWMFGIYRYLLLAESLSGLLAMVAVGRLVQRPRLVAVALFGGLAAVAIFNTVKPDWGHTAHRAPLFRFEPAPDMPADGMLLIAGGYPLSYVVPFLPPTVRVVALYNNILADHLGEDYGLRRRVNRAIAEHRGPFRLLTDPSENEDTMRRALARHGLALGPCALMRTSMDPGGLRFCEVVRVP